MRTKKVATLISLGLLTPGIALAHCPLCTAGAGLAAVIATRFGVSSGATGIFIGAFAVAMGAWISRLLPKKYVPHQETAITAFSFLTTVIPLLPLLTQYSSIYVDIGGAYGSWLNRTYLINLFVAGSVLDETLMLISPRLSGWVTNIRQGRQVPYQGIALTFTLLILSAFITEVVV